MDSLTMYKEFFLEEMTDYKKLDKLFVYIYIKDYVNLRIISSSRLQSNR